MSDIRVNTFFVSEKVAKVRWLPEQLKEAECFLTGSWDMHKNFVRIWRLHKNEYADEYNEYVPKCSDKIAYHGDISGLEILHNEHAVVACSDGHITIVKINRAVEEDTMLTTARSTLLHKFDADGRAAPCTGISLYGNDIATIGEDGRLNIVNAGSSLAVHRTIVADSCSLTACHYTNPQEVLTANRMGVIRMFDIRASGDDENTMAFMCSSEDEKRSNYVSCIASHPTQSHIVLAGSEEGSITVWDLRKPGLPSSYLSAHESAITELGFHRTDPSKVFTTAECGEMWLWQQSTSVASAMEEKQQTEKVNPWLNGERAKSRIAVTALIKDLRKPINTFDAHGSKIVCGSDSEAVYLIDNLF